MNSNCKYVLRRRPGASGVWAYLLAVAGAVGLAAPAHAQFAADSRTLIAAQETCPNGNIDPGETNTVTFVIKNTSGAERRDVRVTLVNEADDAVEFTETAEVALGTIANGATASANIRFRAAAGCGSTWAPKLLVKSKNTSDVAQGDVTVTYSAFTLGEIVKTSYTFGNTTSVAIVDNAKGNPYPSKINIASGAVPNVSGNAGERVDRVTVTLNNVTHSFARDVNVLLVGPGDKKIVLMRDAGGATSSNRGVNNATLSFTQTAGNTLPPNGQIESGTFKPTDFGTGSFPDVAGPYSTDLDALFANTNVNGEWSLYVYDDQPNDAGQIAGGWNLTFRTSKVVCCGAGDTSPFIVKDGRPGISNQEANEDFTDKIVTFTAKDIETSDVGALNITATSSDQTLVSNSQIKIEAGSGGENRQIKIVKPEANRFGTAVITVNVADAQGRTASTSFELKINPVNDRPVLSSIMNQSVNTGGQTPALPFTVSDVETSADSLTLRVESNDPVLIPVSNIFVTGSGNNRQVRVVAGNNLPGEAQVSIFAADPDGLEGVTRFTVKFSGQTGDPTITPIDNTSVAEDAVKTIPVVVRSNTSTPVSNLQITRTSSNASLVPVSAITISGTGNDRTITITPVGNQTGTATITLTVHDPALPTSRDAIEVFDLNVTEVNDRPTISGIAEQTINEDSATGNIAFTIGDIETAASALNLEVASSAPGLVPANIVSNDNDPGVRFGGSGASRTIRVKPVANMSGKATITVTVRDGSGADNATASTSFVVNVDEVNDNPVVASVRRLTPAPAADSPTALASNATDAPVGATIAEDAQLDGDGNPVEQEIEINGINAGPNETDQTVTVTASTEHPNLLTGLSIANGADATQKKLKYKLVKNAYGDATVVLTIADNVGGSTTRKFKVSVTPVNDAPALAAISNRTIPKNLGVTIPINVSDVETLRPLLTMTATSSDQTKVMNSKMAFDAGNTSLTIVPENDQLGDVTITVTATDRGALDNGTGPATSTRTFVITLANVAPPVLTITPAEQTVPEEGAVSYAVNITDDKDPNLVTLSATSDNPALVSVLFNGTGANRTMIVLANDNMAGVANITVVARDGDQLDSSKTVRLIVTQVEDPPTLTLRAGISDGSISANEDVSNVADDSSDSKLIEIGVSDPETPADGLVVTATSSNTDVIPNGNITVSSTGSVRTISIRPAANRFTTADPPGPVTISVVVRDTTGKTATGSFTVAINSVNDEPTINNVANISLNEDAGTQTVNLSGIGSGASNESQTLTVTVSTKNKASGVTPSDLLQNVVLTHTSPDATGTLSFRPVPNTSGITEVTVTVTDSGSNTSPNDNTKSITFEVNVAPINDAPTITAIADQNVPQGGATDIIEFDVADIETSVQELVVTATSNNQTLVPNANLDLSGIGAPKRGIVVRPAAGQSGQATISVVVTDKGEGSAAPKSTTETFVVTVAAGQDPVISSIADVSIPRNSFSSIIEFSVNDSQTPTTDLVVTASSSNTSVIPNGNIQFSQATSNPRALIVRSGATSGSSVITLTVRDSDNRTGTRTFRVNVLGNNPTITAISDINVPRNGSSGPLPFTISDGSETFPGFLVLSATSSNPQLVSPSGIVFGGDVNSGARTVTVTPLADRGGVSDIVITVTDGDGQTATESFRVTVPDLANTPPTISSIGSVTIDRNSSTGPIAFTVTDAQTPAADLVTTAASSDTTLVPVSGIFVSGGAASRTISVTPAQNRSGSATITVTVRDASNATATTSFTVTVREAAPTQNNITDLDGDGRTDLVFQTPDGFIAIWTITNGLTRTSAQFLSPNNVGDPRWRVFGSGDFNSDGNADLAFQHDDGTLAVWIMNRLNFVRGELLNPGNPGPGWRAVATVDYNRDGKMDILFQNIDGTIGVWYMDGVNQTSAAGMSPLNTGNPQWKVVGAGRIDGDQNIDLVFQHDDGTVATWLMNGTTMVAPALLNPSNAGANFRVASVFNVDGQASADLLFHGADGSLAAWYMSGFDLVNAEFSNPSNADSTWRVVAP